ncbi:hypothetical protein RB195_020925 [Necator americanus]|uniref:Uncharacterized protein n=1 Tax=Necator americanus TaxID=51031 RepID=A0ABR1CMU9_NECAM
MRLFQFSSVLLEIIIYSYYKNLTLQIPILEARGFTRLRIPKEFTDQPTLSHHEQQTNTTTEAAFVTGTSTAASSTTEETSSTEIETMEISTPSSSSTSAAALSTTKESSSTEIGTMEISTPSSSSTTSPTTTISETTIEIIIPERITSTRKVFTRTSRTTKRKTDFISTKRTRRTRPPMISTGTRFSSSHKSDHPFVRTRSTTTKETEFPFEENGKEDHKEDKTTSLTTTAIALGFLIVVLCALGVLFISWRKWNTSPATKSEMPTTVITSFDKGKLDSKENPTLGFLEAINDKKDSAESKAAGSLDTDTEAKKTPESKQRGSAETATDSKESVENKRRGSAETSTDSKGSDENRRRGSAQTATDSKGIEDFLRQGSSETPMESKAAAGYRKSSSSEETPDSRDFVRRYAHEKKQYDMAAYPREIKVPPQNIKRIPTDEERLYRRDFYPKERKPPPQKVKGGRSKQRNVVVAKPKAKVKIKSGGGMKIPQKNVRRKYNEGVKAKRTHKKERPTKVKKKPPKKSKNEQFLEFLTPVQQKDMDQPMKKSPSQYHYGKSEKSPRYYNLAELNRDS